MSGSSGRGVVLVKRRAVPPRREPISGGAGVTAAARARRIEPGYRERVTSASLRSHGDPRAPRWPPTACGRSRARRRHAVETWSHDRAVCGGQGNCPRWAFPRHRRAIVGVNPKEPGSGSGRTLAPLPSGPDDARTRPVCQVLDVCRARSLQSEGVAKARMVQSARKAGISAHGPRARPAGPRRRRRPRRRGRRRGRAARRKGPGRRAPRTPAWRRRRA